MTPKKKCLRTAFILIAVAVVFVIVAVCAFAIFNSAVIGVITALLALMLLGLGFSYLSDARCLYCPKCGEKYNYDNVRWEVSNTNEKEKSVEAVVDFEITCSHCGAEREYTRKYVVATIDDNGKVHKKNLQNIIRNQFKSK